jgi:hypothetical protein
VRVRRCPDDEGSDSDWLTHQHRDTLSSIVGHAPLLSYVAIADGETTGRVKFELTEVRDAGREMLGAELD